ncbi:MAG: hypothetical protein GXY36_12915 [Chloroflexi bacterium]|jgi:hypothetical protein|nr:hypothetical protein [Chloroflexota bacterium]
MKRKSPLLLLVLVLISLSACGSEAVSEAYTAAGDGTRPNELSRTSTFLTDDDLNVVIKLGSHNRTLPVRAEFIAPDGSRYATDPLDADPTVGEIVLGLDWEAQGTTAWPTGEWQVDVYVEDERAEQLTFQVQAAQPPAEG